MPRKPNTTGDRYNDTFPSRLRKLIEERGTRQEELKIVLGVKNRQSVTGYIDGSTIPTIDKVVELANFYGVSSDYLLGLAESPTREGSKQAAELYVGLSPQAVDNLHDFMFSGTHHLTKKWCDYLLASDSFIKLGGILAEYAVATLKSIIAQWREEKSKESRITTIHIGESPYEQAKNSAGFKLNKYVSSMTDMVDASFTGKEVDSWIRAYISEIPQNLIGSAEELEDFYEYVKGGGK